MFCDSKYEISSGLVLSLVMLVTVKEPPRVDMDSFDDKDTDVLSNGTEMSVLSPNVSTGEHRMMLLLMMNSLFEP